MGVRVVIIISPTGSGVLQWKETLVNDGKWTWIEGESWEEDAQRALLGGCNVIVYGNFCTLQERKKIYAVTEKYNESVEEPDEINPLENCIGLLCHPNNGFGNKEWNRHIDYSMRSQDYVELPMQELMSTYRILEMDDGVDVRWNSLAIKAVGDCEWGKLSSLAEIVAHAPIKRNFIQSDTDADVAGLGLVIMSYNILWQPTAKCTWSERLPTLIKAFQDRDPDIICLQEVGEGMYQDLKKRLVDYESTLGLATSSSFGCATFFKSKKLSISRQTTCYNVLGVNKEHKRARVVAHFTSLESAETGQNFVVCNIHLLYGFSPYMEKMRGLSVKHIKEVIECYYGKSPQVVCGDFNSKPASQAVQAAAESGLVDVYHQVLSQDPEMTVEVYQHGEPIAVDYVFTTDDFVPLEVLQMPSILSTRRLQLPIPGFEGSDHLYQLVRVFLKPTTRG